MTELEIRPARADDAPGLIASLSTPTRLPPSMAILPPGVELSPAALARWLDHPGRGLFLAVQGETPLGALRWQRASGERTRHKAAVLAAYVRPDDRQRGNARALFEALVDALRAGGVTRVNLWLPAELGWLRDALTRWGAAEWGWEPDGLRADGHRWSVVRSALSIEAGARAAPPAHRLVRASSAHTRGAITSRTRSK